VRRSGATGPRRRLRGWASAGVLSALRALARVPAVVPAVVLAALVLLLRSRSSLSQPPIGAGLLGASSEDVPLFVDANELQYDRDRDTITAEGDVVVTHGTSVLAADRVQLDRKQGEAEAEGSIVLEDPQGRVRAQRAWLEMQDETGYLEEGHIYLPETRFQIAGGHIEKGIGQTYRIWDGTLTTCQCEDGAPDWSIAGEDIDVQLEGYGVVRDGTFRIKDVPVMYLPYGLFPVLRERQSGFLFPQFGISNSRGFQWTQPFYWAIDKTQDATISFDVETSARLGALAEYRYSLAPDAGGVLTGTYFNEAIRGTTADEVVDPDTLADPTIPENRGSVIGRHDQPGPWENSRFYVRPYWVSDNLFLREMNTLGQFPTVGPFYTVRRSTDSFLGLTKVWDWGLFKGEAHYFQDLIAKQSRVPQPLPRLTFQGRQSILAGRVRLALNTELVNFWRAPLSAGPRFDFAPEARVPYRVGSYGYGSFRVVLRETAYYLPQNENPVIPFPTPSPAAPVPTVAVPHFQHREIAHLTADFNSEVSRVYRVGVGELTRAKHTIEPFLRYDWVPVVDQADIPYFDSVDRMNARNLVTYGVVSRLLGKFGGDLPPADPQVGPASSLAGDAPSSSGPTAEPPAVAASEAPSAPSLAAAQTGRIRELARAFVQQSYEISHPFVVQLTDQGAQRANLSGLDAGLRLTPLPWFGASGRGTWSFTENKLLYGEVGVNLFDPRPVAGPDDLFLASLRPVNSASLFYQFNSGNALENLNFTASYRVTNNVAFAYLGRFDAIDNQFLENWVGFRLISACDCWVVDVAGVDRANPNELEFRVMFSLVGLGSFGQQPFGQGYRGFGRLQPVGSDLGGAY
jgi:LPS-assembly protein